MDKFAPSSTDRSRSGTPANGRFASQAATTEDLLKEQTVGLVNLNDFRKRRAEVIERKERGSSDVGSGTTTPRDGASTPQPSFKKKRKIAAKGKLSFGLEDEEAESAASDAPSTPGDTSAMTSDADVKVPKKKLGSNSKIGIKPRVMTKSALAREAEQVEIARKDFLVQRDLVKATELCIPFVFYDGTNIPGGRCRLKKGDHIWLFLDRARKLGAELGVGGDRSKRDWARVSVDDLMLVRGEVILPHHYEFYYFLFNKAEGFDGLIFDYSAEVTEATPKPVDAGSDETTTYDPLHRNNGTSQVPMVPDNALEGFNDDPTVTKVVDRRWYEPNKHIYPASVWEEYKPDKQFLKTQRKDVGGNVFFFS